MDVEQILEISDRGQITIPKKMREIFKGKLITIRIVNNQLILSPLQTVNSFLNELDEAQEDWEKNGGLSTDEMKKKYGL
ncbi:AbrB/MazE/SpoVT family DNA-binding domain-containing protein [Candidatus Peregrinibacteria bacterium]|nr:AbrB/MazE/SpoVT family DNA-binding domain-containing protein [Candidatus Peregrinibacteria bacterium]